MTDDEIIEAYERAEFKLLAFARAIIAAEREACADLCMQEAARWGASYDESGMTPARMCAAAIRSRTTEKHK